MLTTFDLKDILTEIGDPYEFATTLAEIALQKGTEAYPDNPHWAARYAIGVLQVDIGSILSRISIGHRCRA